MKIPTVEKFLCCFELRTGGLVCGWLGVVGSVIGVILSVLAMIFSRKFINDHLLPVNFENEKTGFTIAIMIMGIIIILISALDLYCSWKLLKGIENVSIIIFIVKLLPVHQLIINICLF